MFDLSSAPDCGDNLIWMLDSEGTLTVSGKGERTDVPRYSHRTGIRKVILTKGVTSICDQAFYDCDAFKSITIPASVTVIGDDALSSEKLNNVVFQGDAPAIAEDAFSCLERGII